MSEQTMQNSRINSYLSKCKNGCEIRLSKFQLKKLLKGQSIPVYRNHTKYIIGPKLETLASQKQIQKLQAKIKELQARQK